MRRRYVVALLVLSGCRQSPPPEPAIVLELPPGPASSQEPEPSPAVESQPSEEHTWSARSADGKAEVRQTASGSGKALRCRTLATLSTPAEERSVVWAWETCLATREQLPFVSPEGRRVLVIDPSPALTQGSWRDVEVAVLYEQGLRVRSLTAAAFVRDEKALRQFSGRFGWVKGHAGLPGEPPRYGSGGTAVELETVDGHTFRLGFEGRHDSTASRMYRYADEAGTQHIVSSMGEIPSRYRSQARPVEAEVSIVPGGSAGSEDARRPSEDTPPDPPASPPPAVVRDLDSPLARDILEKLRNKPPAQLLKEAGENIQTLEESRKQIE